MKKKKFNPSQKPPGLPAKQASPEDECSIVFLLGREPRSLDRGGSTKKGMTLVEIISVVGIIGLLAALAMPAIMRARETALKNTCIANMKRVKDAVTLWAMDERKEAGETPNMDDIVPNYLKTWPSCGSLPYEIPAVDSDPTCPQGISDHRL